MSRDADGGSGFADDSLPACITTSITHRGDGKVLVLAVGGDIDLSTAPALETAIEAVLSEKPTALVIDLSAVEFLASVGLRLLTVASERAEMWGRFGVVADNPSTRKPIQVIGLDQLFSVFPTLDEAVRSLQNGDPGH